MFMFLAIPLLYQYNDERGKRKGMELLFFVYYLSHLVLIKVVRFLPHRDISIIF